MTAFDLATALTPAEPPGTAAPPTPGRVANPLDPSEPSATGAWVVDLDPAWQVAGRLNGGYLLSALGRAALELAGPDHVAPLAATAQFVAAPGEGPARVEAAVTGAGRTTTQVRAKLMSERRPCVDALVTCGRLHGDVWWDGVPAPEMPPEAECVRLPTTGPGFDVPLMSVLSERLDPACLGWTVGAPSGGSELRGWLRFADGRDPDPLSLLLAVDAFPPASFELGGIGWVPTLALTVHVLAAPSPGALRVRQRVRHVAGGRLDEECDVWDSTGRLVATGHQLAGIRVPPGTAPAGSPGRGAA